MKQENFNSPSEYHYLDSQIEIEANNELKVQKKYNELEAFINTPIVKRQFQRLVNFEVSQDLIDGYIINNNLHLKMDEQSRYKLSDICNRLDSCVKLLSEIVDTELKLQELEPPVDLQREELVMKVSTFASDIKKVSDSYRFVTWPHIA